MVTTIMITAPTTDTLSVVSMCVGHAKEPCKTGWTDHDAIWGASADMKGQTRGPKEQCIRWECTVAPPSEYNGSIYTAAVIRPIATITVATCYMYYNPARLSWKTGRRNSHNPTQPATTLRLLYRSTCVSRHLQLRAEGFCWCKVLLPACPCWQKPAHSD